MAIKLIKDIKEAQETVLLSDNIYLIGKNLTIKWIPNKWCVMITQSWDEPDIYLKRFTEFVPACEFALKLDQRIDNQEDLFI